MNKITQGMMAAIVAGCFMGNVAQADNHTVSIGYAQSKVQDFKNIRGVNVQYRYEWDSPISVLGSFSYMKGDKSWSFTDYADDYYHQKIDVKSYSLLAGPAYRINDIVNLYGLLGLSHTKAKGDYQWVNSVGGNTATGHEEGHVSKNSTNFAYGAGVIINPMENIAVNIGYEGTQADMDGHKSMNGFNISVGYRF
ncbi:Ail/Lom family outer membrane beta-barrel protein [Providencia rettgeri]|nr:Ail/Lom family outer membrane beta-barrel protein [Providencia rettgeri]QXB04808.1 Ail/Lom family outer membrane beta-barrel protein [Providencia rettgeri]